MAKNSMRIFWNHRTFLQTSSLKKKRDCLLLCEVPQVNMFSTCPGEKSVIDHVRNLGLTLRIWTWVHPTHGRVAPNSFLRSARLRYASAPQPD